MMSACICERVRTSAEYASLGQAVEEQCSVSGISVLQNVVYCIDGALCDLCPSVSELTSCGNDCVRSASEGTVHYTVQDYGSNMCLAPEVTVTGLCLYTTLHVVNIK